MFTVSGYDIEITKGDTGYLQLDLEDVTGDYSISIDVREYADGPLLFKGYICQIDDALVWLIRPEDTEDAAIRTYVWDCYIESESNENFRQHITYINKFKVLPRVTERDE